jgi:hypothetical protein
MAEKNGNGLHDETGAFSGGHYNRQGSGSGNFHVSFGGEGIRTFQIMAILLLVIMAAVGGVAGTALWISITNHTADHDTIQECSLYSDLTYQHIVNLQAKMEARGFKHSELGDVPKPPDTTKE